MKHEWRQEWYNITEILGLLEVKLKNEIVWCIARKNM
jgi:hypothetical protein